ncbi:hypothetical protein GCM10009740_23380 [Terrabacter terrae]|uniref:Flagellar FliJ protein n=1 Tax=Terrabacter terrae TaxID=318434 RepID=A0ABN2UAR6_9MICO
MEATPHAAADAAGERAQQLARRRDELLSGAGSTDADVRAASRSAELSVWRARAAHARSGLAHDRAAMAHDRAAAVLERQALHMEEPRKSILLNDAAAHRRAARADRLAAEQDRGHVTDERQPDAS